MIRILRIFYYSKIKLDIPPQYHLILMEYSDYYKGLSQPLKVRFLKRLVISKKFLNFQAVQFPMVTDEMSVLITSALIQMTFGLRRYVLKRFKTIFVVPNTYSFAQYPALLGHVDHDKNVIAMSWPAIKKGYIIPDDAMNVALHELAHAIQGEHQKNLFYNKFFSRTKKIKWSKEGLLEIYRIRQNKSYLREYAGQNLSELFAVSMECFFEQPDMFKKNVPKLYVLMAKLLNQDPVNKKYPLLS